jgi:hypothetical protein
VVVCGLLPGVSGSRSILLTTSRSLDHLLHIICLVSLVFFYVRLIADLDEVFDAIVRFADFAATNTKLRNGFLGCNRVVC